MDKKAPEKKQRLLEALDQGMVMIHLDARRPGVLVPSDLKTEAHLRLNLSYRFDPPDLSVGEWGVRSTLSFRGSRFTVAVPWNALFAITSYATKDFWLYPDDMPQELIEQSMQRAAEEPDDDKPSDGPAALAAAAGVAKPRAILREVVNRPPPSPEAASEPAPRMEDAAPRPAPSLSPVAPVSSLASTESESGPEKEPPKPPSRGHLRLVK